MNLSPFILVLLSAVLWAAQPTFILFMGQRAIDDSSILILNTVATAVVAFCYAFYSGAVARLSELLPDRRIVFRFAATLILDGALVALAYFFLFKSAGSSNLASAAIFFEAWPIVTLLYLYVASPRAADHRSAVVVSASILFVIGFVMLNVSETGERSLALSSDLIYSFASALFFGIGVAIVQNLVRQMPQFSRLSAFSFLAAFRALATSVFILLLVFVTDELNVETRWSGPDFILSLFFGVLVFANTVLYHLGMFRAKNNAIGLLVLISPVLAPLFIFMLGLGVPQMLFFVGAAFIFAGISVTSRTEDNTPQFQLLLFLILAAGSSVIFLDGGGDENYFGYVQTLFIFYGLLQVALLTKCYDKYVLMFERFVEFQAAMRARDLAGARVVSAKIRFMRQDASSLSELMLLSVIAIGGTVISIMSRDNSLLGDATAFLIAVATAFMALLCWFYQIRTMTLGLRHLSPAIKGKRFRVRGRLLSYAVSITLFAWFLALIIYKNSESYPAAG